METKVVVAIIALIISSSLSAIGLFLNFRTQQKANRIAVASRYSEAAKIITDEIQARVDIITLVKTKAREKGRELPKSMEEIVKEQRSRIKEVGELRNSIENKFDLLDKEDPAAIEKLIFILHSYKREAEDQVIRIKAKFSNNG